MELNPHYESLAWQLVRISRRRGYWVGSPRLLSLYAAIGVDTSRLPCEAPEPPLHVQRRAGRDYSRSGRLEAVLAQHGVEVAHC